MIAPPISILIPNYAGHEAIQLCIESIRARTDYSDYRIVVFNSLADGLDEPVLRRYAERREIALISAASDLDHGQAVNALLAACRTAMAVILDSDVEILSDDWLSFLVNKFTACRETNPSCIALGRFRDCITTEKYLVTPTIWLAAMLIDVERYRLIAGPDDWREDNVDAADFKGKFRPPAWPPQWDGKIGVETGHGFWEKMVFGNKAGFTACELSYDFFQAKIRHYGGLSRNHERPDHPEIAPKWASLRARLAALRESR